MMGPTPKETKRGGPTKPSDKMETKSPEQPKSTDHPSQQLMMKELEKILDNIYKSFNDICKNLEELVQKVDERTEKLGKRVDSLDEKINRAEEKIGKFEKDYNNFKMYVNNQISRIAELFRALYEFIGKIPVKYKVAREVSPGTPGAIPVITENGEVKWCIFEEVEGPLKDYPPIKENFEKALQDIKDLIGKDIEYTKKTIKEAYTKSS